MNHSLSFKNAAISDFLDMLAKDVPPLPAGGSAAALCGAVAASLGILITRLMLKHSNSSQDQIYLQKILDDLNDFKNTYLDLIDEDKKAYEKVFETTRVMKKRNADLLNEKDDLQEAYALSLKPPMVLIETTVKMLLLFQFLEANIYETITADMNVAVETAYACFSGGHMIARENLKKLKNSNMFTSFSNQLNDYQSKCESLYQLHRENKISQLKFIR